MIDQSWQLFKKIRQLNSYISMNVEMSKNLNGEDLFNIEDHISSMLENVLKDEDIKEIEDNPEIEVVQNKKEQVVRKTKKINTHNYGASKYNFNQEHQIKKQNFEKYCTKYNPKLLVNNSPFLPKSPSIASQYPQFYSNLMSPIPFRSDYKRTRTVNHGQYGLNFEFSPELSAFSTNHCSLVDSYQSSNNSPV